MKKYKLLYIDDEIDLSLSEFLDNQLNTKLDDDIRIEYSEYKFTPSLGYKCLLNDEKIQEANIILIDSRLFEDRNASEGKFSGEEFKFIIKSFFPFIEVIVISQNKTEDALKIISKYNPDCGKSASEYYSDFLPKYIKNAMDQVELYRTLAIRFMENDNWEPFMKERVLGILEGIGKYDELTKKDIDTLVSAFNGLVEKING